MKALNVAVRETPVGLVARLPPNTEPYPLPDGQYRYIGLGDVLGVVTKCGSYDCDGGVLALPEWEGYVQECYECDGTGYAPFKFVKVLAAWRIVTMSQACAEDAPPMPFVVTRGPGGLDVLAGWPDPAHETLLDLPDAEPGGVALHVEWTPCPDCGGTEGYVDSPCPTCQTPFVPPSDDSIVEVK